MSTTGWLRLMMARAAVVGLLFGAGAAIGMSNRPSDLGLSMPLLLASLVLFYVPMPARPSGLDGDAVQQGRGRMIASLVLVLGIILALMLRGTTDVTMRAVVGIVLGASFAWVVWTSRFLSRKDR